MAFTHLFLRYLREQGLPVTQQREQIADVVLATDGHLSVEDIEEKLKERGERIGKATIYRTLETLVKSGLVAEHDFGEGFKRYEHLFGQKGVRQHLVCSECGSVKEIDDPELLRLQQRLAREQDFEPARYRLQMYGICASCRAQGRSIQWQGLTCPIEL